MNSSRELVVADQYSHRAGGQAVAERLVRLANETGSRAVVVAPPGDWPTVDIGASVIRYPAGLRGIGSAIFVLRRLVGPSSVAVANGPRVALPVWVACRTVGGTAVLYVHNAPHRSRLAAVQRRLLTAMSRRFDVTVLVADYLRPLAGRADAITLHNAPDPDLRRELGGWSDRRRSGVVKFLGRADPVKGLDLLERLLDKGLLLDGSVVQIAVGPSLHRRGRHSRGQDQPEARRAACAEYVGPRTAKWFAPGDVVCVPSRLELSPMVVLEAMSRGAVVVASDSGGTSEVVVDGVNGFLFRSTDVHDLARALNMAITLEDDAFFRIQDRALDTVDRLTRQWEEFWRGLLGTEESHTREFPWRR